MSVLGNVSIRLTEEQGMLLDVARGYVRDQAPIEAVRAQLETDTGSVSYTHLRAHETPEHRVCRLLLV